MKKEIQELTEGMQRLCAVANRVVQGESSRIEVDLLLENLRRLYEIALRLQTSDERGVDQAMAMVSTMAAMMPESETPIEPVKPVAEVSVKPKKTKKEAPVEPMEPMVEKFAEPVTEVPVEPKKTVAEEPMRPVAEVPVEPMKPTAPTVQKDEVPQVVEMPLIEDLENNDNALLFDEVVIEQKEPSLLDYLSRTPQRTLGESLGTTAPLQEALEKKVDDLRTVININDKFSFMSELFKGNMKAYNDFIMRLNATESRAEALVHVSDIATQYKWDDASPTVKTFYKIFNKKF